ncbi:MAG: helix-turn-helix domain-containing protein [Rhizomicrobium sp.]
MTDYVRQKGTAAFGTRLRRLSERLDRQVLAVYREHDSAFQPRWFAVVGALREKDGLAVGELAALLGITHAAVSQLRGELIAAGLVRAKADPADGRRSSWSCRRTPARGDAARTPVVGDRGGHRPARGQRRPAPARRSRPARSGAGRNGARERVRAVLGTTA